MTYFRIFACARHRRHRARASRCADARLKATAADKQQECRRRRADRHRDDERQLSFRRHATGHTDEIGARRRAGAAARHARRQVIGHYAFIFPGRRLRRHRGQAAFSIFSVYRHYIHIYGAAARRASRQEGWRSSFFLSASKRHAITAALCATSYKQQQIEDRWAGQKRAGKDRRHMLKSATMITPSPSH